MLTGLSPLGAMRSSRIARQASPGSTDPYTSADECAKCHASIHKYWSESTHSKAVQSALFRPVLEKAITADNAWEAISVDECWQLDQWGSDPEAEKALESRRRDFFAAAKFLELLD